MNRKNKSVSFRLLDAYELKMLEWAESEDRGDYSKYVKRLIGRDMESHGIQQVQTHHVKEVAVKNDFTSFI